MKKTLYIDMDGVVADFDKGIKQYDPFLSTLPEPSNTLEHRRKRVNEICEANPRIFLELPVIYGAHRAIKELSNLYDLYFLSTPMWNVPESFTDKRIWLEKHFGIYADKNLILTHKKNLNIGHFLVDDNYWHGTDEFQGLHIHFGSERWPNWETVVEYLKRSA